MKIVIAVLAVMPMLAHAAPVVPRDLYVSNLQTKTAGLSAAIADGKMDKAGEALNGLFTGAASKEKGSETSAVAAGEWTVEPRTDSGLSKFVAAPRKSRMLPLIERLDGDNERGFKIVPVDLKEEAAKEIIKEIVKVTVPVVKEVVKQADQALSDKLTAPDTERARQEYGGCRMKGTCPK